MSMILVSRTHGLKRMLGLLIHPTAPQAEYTREGLFMSIDYELGGLKFWGNAETTTIKLV